MPKKKKKEQRKPKTKLQHSDEKNFRSISTL
nr:MAG TPA: hypothetical protein [Caudoviricetes sp.]